MEQSEERGVYKFRIELQDGRAFVDSGWNQVAFHDEKDLFHKVEFMYTDGNYGCDCNKELFLARARNAPKEEENDLAENGRCGEKLKLKRIVAIRPDGTEEVVCNEDIGG